jgi:hypothetical protein
MTSKREIELMDGRQVIWRASKSDGVSLKDVMADLQKVVQDYGGPVTDLLIGYWEYGDEIVVTAPESSKQRETTG